MRGTWTGSGTFETTSGGPAVLAAVAVVAAVVIGAVVEWLTHHVWEVIGAAATVLALGTAVTWAFVRLVRVQQAREAAWGERRQAVIAAQAATELPGPQRAALGSGGIHLHFYGQPTPEQAAVIRQAIERNTP